MVGSCLHRYNVRGLLGALIGGNLHVDTHKGSSLNTTYGTWKHHPAINTIAVCPIPTTHRTGLGREAPKSSRQSAI